jgi:hypothetical protein
MTWIGSRGYEGFHLMTTAGSMLPFTPTLDGSLGGAKFGRVARFVMRVNDSLAVSRKSLIQSSLSIIAIELVGALTFSSLKNQDACNDDDRFRARRYFAENVAGLACSLVSCK